MNQETPANPVRIEDGETLFRAVWSGRLDECYYLRPNGVVEVSSSAFTDPKKRPSVDRRALCSEESPHFTIAYSDDDGVVSLRAGAIRGIDSVFKGQEKSQQSSYAVDVEFRPLDGKPAHSEIFANPHIGKNARVPWRRLREALAWISTWEIYPKDTRDWVG